jgi:hypothetical protein
MIQGDQLTVENKRNRIIAIIWSAKGGGYKNRIGDYKFQCRPIE